MTSAAADFLPVTLNLCRKSALSDNSWGGIEVANSDTGRPKSVNPESVNDVTNR